MKVKINSVHFKTDKSLDDFIESKLNKLFTLHESIHNSDVTLRVDKDDSHENKVVEIRLDLPGGEIFAKKQCKTFEEATDMTIDALKKQLIKHKEKTKSKV
jgi:putative sigma-54 modulation protein